ncbi:unnamed protein product [Ambrosiozyma monospora]|uniref:Unnamed protein product n=1 Tax=Ambrosiozyma monospora TaxID=43982 RepID=A0ACB5U244_AMBMO|nr:unnamed protein product [Ambrosiozyma monospora]
MEQKSTTTVQQQKQKTESTQVSTQGIPRSQSTSSVSIHSLLKNPFRLRSLSSGSLPHNNRAISPSKQLPLEIKENAVAEAEEEDEGDDENKDVQIRDNDSGDSDEGNQKESDDNGLTLEEYREELRRVHTRTDGTPIESSDNNDHQKTHDLEQNSPTQQRSWLISYFWASKNMQPEESKDIIPDSAGANDAEEVQSSAGTHDLVEAQKSNRQEEEHNLLSPSVSIADDPSTLNKKPNLETVNEENSQAELSSEVPTELNIGEQSKQNYVQKVIERKSSWFGWFQQQESATVPETIVEPVQHPKTSTSRTS